LDGGRDDPADADHGQAGDRAVTEGPFIVLTGPSFVVGIGLRDGRAVEYPPIVKYMAGWTAKRIEEYAELKGWKYEMVER
jgi:hypothetical protein